jgi:VIT1/CCC1 family predicted Fe2+/Mn2+ transporter
MRQLSTTQETPAGSLLARAVQTPSLKASAAGRQLQHHRKTNQLRDVILGGQDGLVNILGIVLGVIAGGGSRTVLLATGFAAAITESVSMGAVGYTSTIADRDYYQAERKREIAEIDTLPADERRELRTIYSARGFTEPLLGQVVDTITANRERWLETVMDDELHLQPVQTRDAARSSVVITIATLIGHLIPLLPFIWLDRTAAVVVAVVLSALVLFGIGAYSAITLVGNWRRSGLKMIAIGLGAAAIGFVIGRLFQTAA